MSTAPEPAGQDPAPQNDLGQSSADESGSVESGPREDTVVLSLPHLTGRLVTAQVSYPAGGADLSWNAGPGQLTVRLGPPPAAALIQLMT